MSEQRTIAVEVPVEDEFIDNIMVTMVESGYGCLFYWGSPSFVNRDSEGNPTVFTFYENEEAEEARDVDDATVTVYTMTRDMVAPAIERIIKEKLVGSALMPYLTRAVLEQDAGDIDATLADCILQVAVFGEVRYG